MTNLGPDKPASGAPRRKPERKGPETRAPRILRESTGRLKNAAIIGIPVILFFVFADVVTPWSGCGYRRAKLMATRRSLGSLVGALRDYKVRMGRYPTTGEGLAALVSGTGLLSEVPKDCWHREFRYLAPPDTKRADFLLISAGPDGRFGTGDDLDAATVTPEKEGVP